MKGKWHFKKFYFKKDFSSNTIVGFSEFDCLINEFIIPLLEHFDKHTLKSTAR